MIGAASGLRLEFRKRISNPIFPLDGRHEPPDHMPLIRQCFCVSLCVCVGARDCVHRRIAKHQVASYGGRLLSSAQAIILEVHTLNKFVANENCCLAGSQISSKRSGPTSAKKYPLDVWPKRSTKKCAECDQSIASLQKGARTHFFCMCATKKVYAHSVSRSHTGMAHSMPSLVALYESPKHAIQQNCCLMR